MQWINQEHVHNASQLAKKYQNAKPYPHLQLADFLEENQFTQLVEALSQLPFEHKENDLFSLAQTPALQSVDDKTIQSFIDFMNSQETREWFKEVTGVTTTPGELDIFGAIYQDTDYLLPHDDQLEDRKVAWILYLTTLTQEQGGALALYSDEEQLPKEKIKAYQPIANSIAFFTVSPESWHEVEEVTADVSRVSIGGWLK